MNKFRLYLKIIDRLREGSYPADIAKELGYKNRQGITRHIRLLKKHNVIEQIGAYVWKVHEEKARKFFESEILPKKVNVHTTNNSEYPENTIRGHGFQFTLVLFKRMDHKQRRKTLDRCGFKDKWSETGTPTWKGEKIELNGWTVRFTPTSIVCYFSKERSIYGDDPKEQWLEAVQLWKSQVIKPIEKMFATSFQQRTHKGLSGYQFRTSAEHYAFIKSCEARDLRIKKKKLLVYNDKGKLWLIADYSHSEDEIECILSGKDNAPGDAVDHATLLKNNYNSIIDTKMDYNKVLNLFAKTENQMQELNGSWSKYAKDMEYYAENQASHVKVLRDLGSGINKMSEMICMMGNTQVGMITKEKPLKKLKSKIKSINDLHKFKKEILKLSENDRLDLSMWTFEKFGQGGNV